MKAEIYKLGKYDMESFQQMSMSEQDMIWAPHLYSRQTGQSLAVRVQVTSSDLRRRSGLENLYSAMSDEFEQLWTESANVAEAEVKRNRRRPRLAQGVP
jgi:hypothetical protein